MKVVIIGAGAHRVLGILRGALALPGVFEDGEIALHDLNESRAEIMGRLVAKTPEAAGVRCKIRWDGSLEEKLLGADAVGIILPAGSHEGYARGHAPSYLHGYISSDNVSPSGALCGVKIAPVLLDVARKMEQHCPEAWLINFVNPSAVLSGMVNNHTRIRALGVCQGYTNHLWDIPRLFGRDEEARNLDVEVAGINHLSFILRGTWEGRDLLGMFRDQTIPAPGEIAFRPRWTEVERRNITNSVARLGRFWNELGVVVFSSEGDGMDHLMYDEAVAAKQQEIQPSLAEEVSRRALRRDEAERTFREWADRDLDTAFWAEHPEKDSRFRCEDKDIFVKIFSALGGLGEEKLVVSSPCRGAILGIKDHHVVEYTQYLSQNGLRHEGPMEIPDHVHGLTASLAAHQTLLGDALAEENPQALAHALTSYPMRPYSQDLRALYRELFAINESEIAPAYRAAAQYL